MAKKKGQGMVEPIDEPVEGLAEPEVVSVGERLRLAREEKGLSLEDVAAQTRIPRRHLESLENSDWERLPAPTYTTGFAKSYASAVGLDRTEIYEQLRVEMGGVRPASQASEVFEPADPARTMPKWLVVGAILAVLVLVLAMSWLNERSFQGTDEAVNEPAAAAAPVQADSAPASASAAQGPVVLTANEQVWLQVKDGQTILKEGLLEAGQSFEVPATASAPVLMTGKPEALRISVGTASAPPVGPAATTVRNVSLLGPDLMRGPAAAAAPPAAAAPAAPAAPAPARAAPARAAPARAAPAPAIPAPADPAPVQNSAG
ncbi:MAG TPA: RodZ domain-containing protein [Sphingomicrobium sp.]|nr:RodZ domain-containing protein [Sphingomicrobium sp.]